MMTARWIWGTSWSLSYSIFQSRSKIHQIHPISWQSLIPHWSLLLSLSGAPHGKILSQTSATVQMSRSVNAWMLSIFSNFFLKRFLNSPKGTCSSHKSHNSRTNSTLNSHRSTNFAKVYWMLVSTLYQWISSNLVLGLCRSIWAGSLSISYSMKTWLRHWLESLSSHHKQEMMLSSASPRFLAWS